MSPKCGALANNHKLVAKKVNRLRQVLLEENKSRDFPCFSVLSSIDQDENHKRSFQAYNLIVKYERERKTLLIL